MGPLSGSLGRQRDLSAGMGNCASSRSSQDGLCGACLKRSPTPAESAMFDSRPSLVRVPSAPTARCDGLFSPGGTAKGYVPFATSPPIWLPASACTLAPSPTETCEPPPRHAMDVELQTSAMRTRCRAAAVSGCEVAITLHLTAAAIHHSDDNDGAIPALDVDEVKENTLPLLPLADAFPSSRPPRNLPRKHRSGREFS